MTAQLSLTMDDSIIMKKFKTHQMIYHRSTESDFDMKTHNQRSDSLYWSGGSYGDLQYL